MLVDSHCHLNSLNYEKTHQDIADVLAKASVRGVTHCLSVSVDLDEFVPMVESIQDFPQVYASCGVHPLNLEKRWDDAELLRLAASPKVIAIGETGLDYFYSSENQADQQDSFRRQLRISRLLQKPIIVHTRDARADTLTLLREENVGDAGGILHCFTEDWDTAQAVLDLGMYISISGIVTFRNADMLRDVARRVPADRLLVETDSPYLAPVPHRGHENQPAYVADVAAFVAELRGVSAEALAEQTSANFFRLFARQIQR